MCVDSLGLGYTAPVVGDREIAHFIAACPGEVKVEVAPLVEGRDWMLPVCWSGVIPGLGRLSLNRDGFVQFHQRSLEKVRQELLEGVPAEFSDNVRVMSHKQANSTFHELTACIERTFPYVDKETLSCHRVDVVYQRQVKNSMQTLRALQGAVKPTRLGCAWFDNGRGVATGLMLQGKAVSHRVYDKGLEAKNDFYLNIVRSEEQLRSRSVGLGKVVNCVERSFDVGACMEILNERYLDAGYADELDVMPLIREGKDTMALLVLHPELVEAYRERVKRDAFYKMKRKVREYRATAIPDDMRIPESAWQE